MEHWLRDNECAKYSTCVFNLTQTAPIEAQCSSSHFEIRKLKIREVKKPTHSGTASQVEIRMKQDLFTARSLHFILFFSI